MSDLHEIIGSFTPLERSGEEWRGICPFAQHDEQLAVIGDKWKCLGCSAHDAGDDALAFLRATGLDDIEALQRLAEGGWTPTLTKPTPKPRKYSIPALKPAPAKVLIVDTPLAAKAAAEKLPNYTVYLWPGGGPRWELEALRGREVLLFCADQDAQARLEAVIADPAGLACTGKVVCCEGPDDVAPWDKDTATIIAWAKMRARALQNPAQQVASSSPVSPGSEAEAEAARPEQRAATPPADAGPHTEPQDAPESLVASAEPPPSQDTDFPPEASQRPPRKRRLRVVGGADVDMPDPADAPLPHELSESGIAAHFVKLHRDKYRTVHEWAGKQGPCWMAWDGTRWRREPSRVTAMQDGQQLAHGIKYWDAARGVAELSKVKFESRKFIGAFLDLASYAPEFVSRPQMFDADPFILGTPAGPVDLREGKLLDHDPDMYLTRQTSIAPADGPHPLFDDVIRRASAGERDIADYLWRWLGYLLTGDISQEVFLYAVGKPQSGKTTLVSAIAEILGDASEGGYAAQCDIEMFTETKIDKGNDRLAHLAGARFAYASEMEEGRNFKTALLKMATGGDKLSGRFLYAEKFSFTATHKLWITGNHMLHLKSSDAGLKRRLHLLEYKDAFIVTDEERDNTFKERLRAEYPAILASMIRATRDYLDCGGLGRPERIAQAVDEYSSNEDTLGQWIEECIEINPRSRSSVSDAYQSYKRWLEKEGGYIPSAKRFSQQLAERGFERERSNGVRYFVGFGVKVGANLP